MTHPNSLDLEAFACGEAAEHVAKHIGECTSCQGFVERLRGALSAGPSRSRAAAVVARAAARNADQREEVPSHPTRNEARGRTSSARAEADRRWLSMASTVAVPLAAAAVLLLLLRTSSPTDERAPESSSSSATGEPTTMRILMDPETTFKGSIQIAVIRERAGQQRRFTGTVAVRPGDRLRVEVALDREQDILAAVMGDDASWLELMPEGPRAPGTHFSDRSARVDASPLRGTILVGSPKAVARARSTRQIEGVTSIRVEWEAP